MERLRRHHRYSLHLLRNLGKTKYLSIFAFSLSVLCGCVVGKDQLVSRIDAQYRFQRLTGKSTQVLYSSVSFYRRYLSSFLASSCQLYPSDSSYLIVNQNGCGPFLAVAFSMERFFFEPSADQMYGRYFLQADQWLYEDSPKPCIN